LFGSTTIDVSFCGAAAVSWFTVTAGPGTLVASSGLPGTWTGVIGVAGTGFASHSSASCSMNAEKRICSGAVPLSDATLPARVVTSYVLSAD